MRFDGLLEKAASPENPLSTVTFLVVCLLTVATMFPVTGVVPVLKGLVGERYLVGDFLVSAFMSLNMLGALMARLTHFVKFRSHARAGPIRPWPDSFVLVNFAPDV